MSFYAGFIPEQRQDPLRKRMLDRLRQIVNRFADWGVRVAFETGQETSETLLEAIEDLDRPAVGVNFDPANMILYGMGDPVEALKRMAPCVQQIHIKDARSTRTAGIWGAEVPVGEGEVGRPAFFRVISEADIHVDLMIECEVGDSRVSDIRLARERVDRYREAGP